MSERIEFPVTIYEEIQPYNEVLSKSRCRIFYKYGNRNGTYITDEFADKLASTLPYTPVKGIYNSNDDYDYGDHGEKRSEGKIYGIVPKDYNFAWEPHVDEDGVERIYACADVLLFTAIYEEAKQIVGKSQSMELYSPSIKGAWKFIEGQKFYEFEDGCFLGLQVLGEEIEPCFEGASFFSLYESLIGKIEEKNTNFQLDSEGGQKMPEIMFKLSDSQKYSALMDILNPNFSNSGEISYAICEVYDDYAIARNYETSQYERIYYTKDDATDSVTVNEKKKCYILDISEQELQALNTLRALNGDTYEKIDENFEKKEEKVDNSIEIATLTKERDKFKDSFETAKETIDTITAELNTLKDFKAKIEKEEKEKVISKYTDSLETEVIEKYTQNIDEYTITDLEKELAYELVKSEPSVFSIKSGEARIPKDEPATGIIGILEKYKKD